MHLTKLLKFYSFRAPLISQSDRTARSDGETNARLLDLLSEQDSLNKLLIVDVNTPVHRRSIGRSGCRVVVVLGFSRHIVTLNGMKRADCGLLLAASRLHGGLLLRARFNVP